MNKDEAPEGTPSDSPETDAKSSKVSERKLKANRENAKKSTGPRDTSKTRFNAVTHGLLASKLMFDGGGKPTDENLQQLEAGLRSTYGNGDVRQELLIEITLIESWRQSRVVAADMELFQRHGAALFGYNTGLPNTMRYATASRRSMFQALQMLEAEKQQQEEKQSQAVDRTYPKLRVRRRGILSMQESGVVLCARRTDSTRRFRYKT